MARTLENLGSPEAFVESWHRENDKPLPWRFFLGASAGMFALGVGLLARFILQVQVMFAAPEPGHQGGELAELLPQALARGDQNAALGRLGTGAVLWLLLGTVLLVQGLRGRKRAKAEEGQTEDV